MSLRVAGIKYVDVVINRSTSTSLPKLQSRDRRGKGIGKPRSLPSSPDNTGCVVAKSIALRVLHALPSSLAPWLGNGRAPALIRFS